MGKERVLREYRSMFELTGFAGLGLLIGGDELLMSSDSTAIALFPFFAPGMMERLWSKISDLYP